MFVFFFSKIASKGEVTFHSSVNEEFCSWTESGQEKVTFLNHMTLTFQRDSLSSVPQQCVVNFFKDPWSFYFQ